MENNNQTPAAQNNAPQPQKKELQPWQKALLTAEAKFLAISGKQEEAKIELGFAAMLMEKNPILKQCTPSTIANAVINVARTGITLNPVLKLAHLVPRKNKGVWECTMDFDYKGLVKVLKDNNCVKDIRAVIVYKDEVYEESLSPITPHKHEVKHTDTEEEQNKRQFRGVYAIVLLPDNTVIYTPFMPYWEVLKVEKVSQGGGSEYSPWKKWREEMVKKTKIKRDFKMLISGSPSDKLKAAMEVEEGNMSIDVKPNAEDLFGVEDAQIISETNSSINDLKGSTDAKDTAK
jgi:recombination protein RecT